MGRPKGSGAPLHIWSEEEKAYLAEITPGRHYKEILDLQNKKFEYQFTVGQIKGAINRYKLNTGFNGQFKKGGVPFNKGKKGTYAPGCEKTWFKKGQEPINHRPIGSERVDVDGYTLIKTAEPNKWELKHRILYEEKYGEIPEDRIIIFLDGDKSNLDIDNLMAISRAESAMLNHEKLRFSDKELTKTGVMISKVKLASSKLRKGRQDNVITNDTRRTERQG